VQPDPTAEPAEVIIVAPLQGADPLYVPVVVDPEFKVIVVVAPPPLAIRAISGEVFGFGVTADPV
jgi:hypothetical protein